MTPAISLGDAMRTLDDLPSQKRDRSITLLRPINWLGANDCA
jgi:hypothetical protein